MTELETEMKIWMRYDEDQRRERERERERESLR
jgi:hypothetical protein